MESLKCLYRYGMGPSSSHTIGPHSAAEIFKERYRSASHCRVTLYGSLSLTGKGHLTDVAVISGLDPIKTEVVWEDKALPYHPNGMKFEAFDKDNTLLGDWVVYSVGGGAIREEGERGGDAYMVYTQKNMQEVLDWSHSEGQPIWQLAYESEGDELKEYLEFVWEKMQEAISSGLSTEGVIPGKLKLPRKSMDVMAGARRLKEDEGKSGVISGYALAVSEENASGGYVVTAPTCGSCGVLPAVLYYLHHEKGHSQKSIINALATAGIVGNIAKKNASISGAEVGCQGEVGVACAMASAAAVQLMGGMPTQVEYAAEMGLEHHLGLTCDPIYGLVQIPCIERNAFAAVRAISAAEYALLSDGRHRVSYDEVVLTMGRTGHDMSTLYRETALGGLAEVFNERDKSKSGTVSC